MWARNGRREGRRTGKLKEGSERWLDSRAGRSGGGSSSGRGRSDELRIIDGSVAEEKERKEGKRSAHQLEGEARSKS